MSTRTEPQEKHRVRACSGLRGVPGTRARLGRNPAFTLQQSDAVFFACANGRVSEQRVETRMGALRCGRATGPDVTHCER